MTENEAIEMLRYYNDSGLGAISSYEAGEIAEVIEDLQADNNRLREMWAKAVSDLSKYKAKNTK